jgi:hypothetical protein
MMIYRAFLLLLAVVLFSGCAGISNPFDADHPVEKEVVKSNINQAIKKKNTLADILSRSIPAEELARDFTAVTLDDRRLMTSALARQAVMLERAKNAIALGKIDKEEMFRLWELSADSYVGAKRVANRYTEYFSPSKMASFVLLEDKISSVGKEIETELLDLSDENSNDTFNLIMTQVELMNELFILVISK